MYKLSDKEKRPEHLKMAVAPVRLAAILLGLVCPMVARAFAVDLSERVKSIKFPNPCKYWWLTHWSLQRRSHIKMTVTYGHKFLQWKRVILHNQYHAADALATYGARVSAVMLRTYLSQESPHQRVKSISFLLKMCTKTAFYAKRPVFLWELTQVLLNKHWMSMVV